MYPRADDRFQFGQRQIKRGHPWRNARHPPSVLNSPSFPGTSAVSVSTHSAQGSRTGSVAVSRSVAGVSCACGRSRFLRCRDARAQDNPLDKVHVPPPADGAPGTGAPAGVDAPAATGGRQGEARIADQDECGHGAGADHGDRSHESAGYGAGAGRLSGLRKQRRAEDHAASPAKTRRFRSESFSTCPVR